MREAHIIAAGNIICPQGQTSLKKPFLLERFFLAGVAGFEPAYLGVKDRCLTAWRYPYRVKAKRVIVWLSVWGG